MAPGADRDTGARTRRWMKMKLESKAKRSRINGENCSFAALPCVTLGDR